MSRKIVFITCEGGLVESPQSGRLDRLERVALVAGVIPALARFERAGYELVVVGNAPGLEDDPELRARFAAVQAFLTTLFASQGLEFADALFCPHRADGGCGCRLPRVGLVADYIAGDRLDRNASIAVGADVAADFARNIGVSGFVLAAAGGWAEVAHGVLDRPRLARVERRTRETQIVIEVDLDREAEPRVGTGIGFFDHMLAQLGKHGGFALDVNCTGDLEVDEHHTVEDVALTLGQALRQALGDKRGIQRYGFVLPMDEAAAEVAIDLGGRAYLVFEGKFPREQIGTLPTELVPHFFRSLSDTLGASIQIRVRGENTHHMIEACFKGVARSLRQAFERAGDELPTTKGRL